MRTIVLLTALALCACSDEPGAGSASPGGDAASPIDSGSSADTAGAPDSGASADAPPADGAGADADAADAAVPEPPPNISVALDCGAAPPAGPGNSKELQRHAIDLGVFPDALCNNGDGAVLYFRPYEGEQNKDKWVINLNGGGSCAGGAACAARWCWCQSIDGPDGCPFAESTTNFSMGNMNGDERPSVAGTGILRRGDPKRPSPFSDWNQVRVVYCSSDTWTGTRRDVPFEATHPKTGEPVSYSIHFLGARILDAALATLRRDGVDAPRYTFGASPRDLPDLDDAAEVVLSGDSAGGSGVISNLDRVADLLRAHNSHCQGGACPLVVRGLIDAIVGPEMARLEFGASFVADLGGSTYADYLTYLASIPEKNRGAIADASCLAHHADDAGPCADITHVIRHHVTTPFFVRMALLDGLISSGYAEAGYEDPDLGPMTLETFAVVLQRELLGFPDLPDSAEEGDAIGVAPGVFAPACPKHDTLHDDGEVYQTAITPPGGAPLTLFDVFEPWRAGTPSALLTMQKDRSDTQCAP